MPEPTPGDLRDLVSRATAGDAPSIDALLFRTALNKMLERTRSLTQLKRDVRREARGEAGVDYGELAGREPTASQVAGANELSERMEQAFGLLPEDYREVIALSRIVGLSHAEIAEQMDRSEGATRMLLSRALVAYVAAMDQVGAGGR